MFCPRCGQQQIADDTRFCSKCGFLLTGIAHVIANAGELPYNVPPMQIKKDSPRRRGVKQGAMIFFFGILLIVPIVGLLSQILGFPEEVIGLAALTTIFGGILRMIYAWMFEESIPTQIPAAGFIQSPTFPNSYAPNALPPQHSTPIPVDMRASGRWRETNELATPASIAEHTTKLLERDE